MQGTTGRGGCFEMEGQVLKVQCQYKVRWCWNSLTGRGESTPGGQGSNGGSGGSNGLRFELLGQIVTNKLFYHGRCDFLHVFYVFGTGWHVQDGEERHGLGQVGVVPQRIAHVILSGDENISWSDYYCLKSKITTKKVKKWTWNNHHVDTETKKTALSAV